MNTTPWWQTAMLLIPAIPLIIVGGVLTYSHLQRWADKGLWPGAWWKIPAAACLGAGIWLAV